MEDLSHTIEETYREEISLLQDLVSCLISERESLIEVNIKNLWRLMEEKQKLLIAILNTEMRVKALTEEEGQGCEAPSKDRKPAVTLSRKVTTLKEEIKARVRENVVFIQESLQFFDELISIFATCGRAECSYEPVFRRRRMSPSLIYQSEV